MSTKGAVPYWLIVLVGCGLSASSLGLGTNVAGVFFSPMAGEFGVGQGLAAATLTMYNLAQAVAGMAAPRTIERFGFRRVATIATAIVVACIALFALSPNIWIILGLSLVRGVASGFVAAVTVTLLVNYWFCKNNGLMTSVCMGFSGIAGAVLAPVLTSFVVANGWRAGYLGVAAMTLICNLPAILAPVTLRPEERGQAPYGGALRQASAADAGSSKAAAVTVPILLAVLPMGFAFCATSVTSLAQHFPSITASYGIATAGAIMVSTSMVANTTGKIVLGALVDRLGARISISLFAVLVTVGTALVAFARVPEVLIGAAALVGLSYSLGTVGIAMLTRDVVSPEAYSSVYPKVTLCGTLSNAVFTTLIGTFYDASGSYTMAIVLLAVLEAAALVLALAAYAKAGARRAR